MLAAAVVVVESLVELAHAAALLRHRYAANVAHKPVLPAVEVLGVHRYPDVAPPAQRLLDAHRVELVHVVAHRHGAALQLLAPPAQVAAPLDAQAVLQPVQGVDDQPQEQRPDDIALQAVAERTVYVWVALVEHKLPRAGFRSLHLHEVALRVVLRIKRWVIGYIRAFFYFQMTVHRGRFENAKIQNKIKYEIH